MNNNGIDEISRQKQKQMLKLVTNSFYKELVNYGVDKSDIISVSVNLLDFVTASKHIALNGNGTYRETLDAKAISNDWEKEYCFSMKDVCIKPLQRDQVPTIAEWIGHDSVQKTLISFFPVEPKALASYLFERHNAFYFAIYYKRKNFVGLIGGENIDESSKKLEMKKFIGTEDFRNKGIGKISTFLYLYYTFCVLKYNKVYIHSLDTNINNINLNSKFGFDLEGILYKDVFLNNAHRDVLRMGLLRDKWIRIFSEDVDG